MHPDKTRIVYRKDANRRGEFKHTSFDFLGYTTVEWGRTCPVSLRASTRKCVSLVGPGGPLAGLARRCLESALEGADRARGLRPYDRRGITRETAARCVSVLEVRRQAVSPTGTAPREDSLCRNIVK